MHLRLTDIRNHSVEELDLTLATCDMPGWQSGVVGWSIGPKGSGAPIELDELPGECHVGIFSAGFQLLLWGMAKNLPDIWLFPQAMRTNNLLPFDPERWQLVDREDLSRVAMGGDVRLRIDQSPVRFGNTIIECLDHPASPEGRCAFCNEPLRIYFRVGSQQACPACTEKFKQETRADLARYYRRALRDGILAAVVGGLVHALILAAADISIGSIFTGGLVGMAMRIASRETAGTRYRWTAVLLTFVAGWLPIGIVQSSPTPRSGVYLVAGMIAAWMVTARNIPTEIHGPFHSKTA